MCGRFVLMTPGRDLAQQFGLEEVPDLEPRYNIAPTQMVAIIRLENETGQRLFNFVKWGLIPFWSKDPSIGSRLINCRAESAVRNRRFGQLSSPSDALFQQMDTMSGKRPEEGRNNLI